MMVAKHPLNRRRTLAAIGNWLSWHVRSRLSREPIRAPFVNGMHLTVTAGMTGATGNIYFGLAEWVDMAFVLHALRPGDLFVDVGANIGAYSVLAAGGVGARVLAAEPVPSTFAHLNRNIEDNCLYDRVKTARIGLSSQSGTLMFTADLDTTNHVVTPGDNSDANLVSCPVVTLNEWVADEAPFLLKIDVEGHEDHVILGARVVLANPQLKAMVVETSLCPATGSSDGSKAAEIIQEYGFRPFSYDPMNRELAVDSGEVVHRP